MHSEPRRDERRDDRSRNDDRRDDEDTRHREPRRADAPIVERERAIVPLDPPTR